MTKSPDTDAAEQLIERYAERIFQLAMRVTGDAEQAIEATEEAVRRIAREVNPAEDAARQKACIDRITARAAYDALRRRAGGREELALADLLPPIDDDGHHFTPMPDWSARLDGVPGAAHDGVPGAALNGVLSAALDALPPEYRVALVLRDAQAFTLEDIAAVLGTSAAVAASRVHRARLFVRQRLTRDLVSAA